MLTPEILGELHNSWLPNISDNGLDRLLDLLERASPYLIHGAFLKAVPMGCLATHAAWSHPQTCHLVQDAGITWLARVACLNPATSLVIREWDRRGAQDFELRADLIAEFRAERDRRQQAGAEAKPRRQPVPV